MTRKTKIQTDTSSTSSTLLQVIFMKQLPLCLVGQYPAITLILCLLTHTHRQHKNATKPLFFTLNLGLAFPSAPVRSFLPSTGKSNFLRMSTCIPRLLRTLLTKLENTCISPVLTTKQAKQEGSPPLQYSFLIWSVLPWMAPAPLFSSFYGEIKAKV